jgi:hypothetical protein
MSALLWPGSSQSRPLALGNNQGIRAALGNDLGLLVAHVLVALGNDLGLALLVAIGTDLGLLVVLGNDLGPPCGPRQQLWLWLLAEKRTNI